MIKYKLYTFSGAMYVVPLDKYEYIDNGGKCFDIWCDDYYVIMNKE